jgi:hypothetical protein
MKKKNTLLMLTTLFTMVVFIFSQTGCKKVDENNNPPTGTVDFNVSLKSSSTLRSSYEAINIDIQKISIHNSTDSAETSGWFDLETNIGIYNLLDYDAGNDTLIGLDSLLQVQTVSQIRLILGDNNTIIENGETFDLETPSAQTSGLKVQVHAELQPNLSYKIVLDFDPDQSINKTGNGKYKLKPVINTTVIQQ